MNYRATKDLAVVFQFLYSFLNVETEAQTSVKRCYNFNTK